MKKCNCEYDTYLAYIIYIFFSIFFDPKMKRVQLSGAQKRNLAMQKGLSASLVTANTGKLTNYIVPVKQRDFAYTSKNQAPSEKEDISTVPSVSSNPSFTSSSEHHGDLDNNEKLQLTQASAYSVLATDILINPLDKSTAGCSANPEIEMAPKNKISDDTFQSAEDDEVNKAIHPGLWIDLSTDDVAYWVDCGPSDCQHHDGLFDKSCRTFAMGKPSRYCSQKLFYDIKANGVQSKRE